MAKPTGISVKSTPAKVRVIQTYVNNTPTDDNISSFDFQILRADLRRSIRKLHPTTAKEKGYVTGS